MATISRPLSRTIRDIRRSTTTISAARPPKSAPHLRTARASLNRRSDRWTWRRATWRYRPPARDPESVWALRSRTPSSETLFSNDNSVNRGTERTYGEKTAPWKGHTEKTSNSSPLDHFIPSLVYFFALCPLVSSWWSDCLFLTVTCSSGMHQRHNSLQTLWAALRDAPRMKAGNMASFSKTLTLWPIVSQPCSCPFRPNHSLALLFLIRMPQGSPDTLTSTLLVVPLEVHYLLSYTSASPWHCSSVTAGWKAEVWTTKQWSTYCQV